MISLKQAHIEEMNRQAENEYPYECCGILVGKLQADKGKTVHQVIRISNAREEKAKYNRFLITPDDMMRAERLARKDQLDVLGFYHSHPDHPAIPSDYDREHALPVYSYIIISVINGKKKDLTSWELEFDRSRFNPEYIEIGG